jgi:hypothetical protein
MPTRRPLKREHLERHPLARIRTVIAPAFILGGCGVIPFSFPLGVSFVYLGLMVLLLEVVLEPWIVERPFFIPVGLIAVWFLLFDWFTIGFAASRAPIYFSTLATNIDYSSYSAPGGIPWRTVFSELDVVVSNPTDANYDNVDVTFRPDKPVAEIGQFSNLPGVSFEDLFAVTTRITVQDIGGRLVPLVFLATNAGYRVHCPQIPAHSSLKLIMATAAIKEPVLHHENPGPLILPEGAKPEDITILETVFDPKIDEGTFLYWFGTTSNGKLYLPSAQAKQLLVRGSYTANYRRMHFNETLKVMDEKKQ